MPRSSAAGYFTTCRLPASRQGNCPHPFNINPFVWFDVRFEMNERALKNFYTLSTFQICLIRDFWASSEISMIFLDIEQRIVY